MATKDNSKYLKWAIQNKTEEKTDKDKEMLKQIEQEELNVSDSYKRKADGWTDKERDDFKRAKATQEGVDYTVDLQKLNSVIAEGKPVVILAVGTTGTRGSNEETFFSSRKSKDATKKANGDIELTADNIKNCANDTLTQISFVYYEKGEDGFYHESPNPDLSLKIPLINVAPSIIQRAEEDVQDAITNKRYVYDVFKEGGIDVNDLKARKGMQSDEVVRQIDAYLNKEEVKNAILVDYQGSKNKLPGAKKDFATNMISHTYDAVNLMVKGNEKHYFTKDIDINLCHVVNGYHLTNNRRIISGKTGLNDLVDNLKKFKGEEPMELHTTNEKVAGIAYLLNEFCLREMLEKNSPETNLKIFDYCTLYDLAEKNQQEQTEENRQKLASLRSEIFEEIENMKSELEYNRSLDETFGDSGVGFIEPDMSELEEEAPEMSEEFTEEPEYMFDENTDAFIEGNFDEEFEEEYKEEDDLAYTEASAIDSVEDMAVVPMATKPVEVKEKAEPVLIEGVKNEGNLYTDKEGGVDVPVVKADNIEKVGSVKIPEIPKNIPEKEQESYMARELKLVKHELELRNLEADLKLKEIELAKRELELKQKEPEMVRLAQNNNFALMQTFCKTIGAYLSDDKTAQKNIMSLLTEMKNIQKEYNDKMLELDRTDFVKEDNK